jgi:aromatic ring-opening dioxygenase LigB subunit
MNDLDKALLQAYGTQIEKCLEEIKREIVMVIAAHLYDLPKRPA